MNQEEQDEVLGTDDVGITHSTSCEHEWVIDDQQDPNSDMVSYRCVNCWSGMNVAKE